MAKSSKPADRWSSSDKFKMVLEAASLSEEELSGYCRRKGIYPEQIAQWRQACELANGPALGPAGMSTAAAKAQARQLKKVDEQAVQESARQALACRELGLSSRTLQPWQHQAVMGDPMRCGRRRPTSSASRSDVPCWKQPTVPALPV